MTGPDPLARHGHLPTTDERRVPEPELSRARPATPERRGPAPVTAAPVLHERPPGTRRRHAR
ncbi:hypothetical protein [Kitasatospora sp. NPDC004531]